MLSDAHRLEGPSQPAACTFDPRAVGRAPLQQHRQHQLFEPKELAPAEVARGAFTMTVGANEITFGEFHGYPCPGPGVPRELGDFDLLLTRVAVIEFQNGEITYPTIKALIAD